MARGRTLTLKVDAEVKGLDKLDKLGDKLVKFGKAATVGLTVPLVAAGAAALKFASDTEEATAKASTVFTESSDKILREAKNLDDAFSEATFLDTAGTFGALLQTMGLTEQAAADLSVEWLKLSQDMASFHNTKPEEALGAIQSALAGEFEPLKRYGVQINEARLKQKALELGIYDGIDALTAEQKTLALNALLFEDQTKVIGDFERTAGGFANSSRKLVANFTDAMSDLGEELLPFATEAVQGLSDLVQQFKELPDEAKETIVQLGTLAAVIGPLAIVAGSLAGALKNIHGLLKLIGLTPAVVPITLVIAASQSPGAKGLQETVDQLVEDTIGPTGGSGPTATFNLDLSLIPPTAQDIKDQLGEPGKHVRDFLDTTTEDMRLGGAEAASVFATEIGGAPEQGADAMLANQFELSDAITQLTDFMEQSLTPAQQMFNAQGFLQSQELADGLVSNNPYVALKAQEMQQAAIDALKFNLHLAMDAGMALASTYAAGIVNNKGVVVDAAHQLVQGIRSVAGIDSEPEAFDSPLRGITQWGGNIAKTYAAGIMDNLDVVRSAATGLAGAAVPAIAAPRPQRSAALLGSTAGNVTNINLTFTGTPPDATKESELIAALQRLAPFIDGRLAPGY